MLGQRAPPYAILLYLLSTSTALVGTAIFFAAFFPGSPRATNNIVRPTTISSRDPATRERVVIMLVDALRADFIWQNGSRFAFVNEKIAAGAALPFITRAHPPTVTLPRIKAMITGTIPGFLDVKANLDSPALQDDNIVSKAVDAGRRILMFGDETWLKLFPSAFVRSDGTTAFYVLDTQVVDDNVTRHVMPELENNDWDVMILHYLGLDHAGHLGGADSDIMHAKQVEMDDVLRQMYTKVRALEELGRSEGRDTATATTIRRTTIVLSSDHGMNSGGNHGGATEPETDAVAVFMPPPPPTPRHASGSERGEGEAVYTRGARRVGVGEPFPLVWQVHTIAYVSA